jgi:hypothetical protein
LKKSYEILKYIPYKNGKNNKTWHSVELMETFIKLIYIIQLQMCDFSVMWKLEIYNFSAGVFVWKLEIFCRRFYVFIGS